MKITTRKVFFGTLIIAVIAVIAVIEVIEVNK